VFTGIVEELGKVKTIRHSGSSAVLTIECKKILDDIDLGDSIAVNGVCLTVVNFDSSGFSADVMPETMAYSSLGSLKAGSPVNLERAMAASGRFGGHIVSGHIDGTGSIVNVRRDSNAVWYEIACSRELCRFVIKKGSVALDGISLTVAELFSGGFAVSIIPHTLEATALGKKKAGDTVNIENDCIGKYVAHLMSFDGDAAADEVPSGQGITEAFLAVNGF